MKKFGGPVLFLDRADINTDEIIPAKYLTEIDKDALRPHLLEDLKMDGFDPAGDALKNARVIVTRANFGCGSSREHAPWALEVNGITAVIAPSFARIFRQNMFNCGMMAIELDEAQVAALFERAGDGAAIEFDLKSGKFAVSSGKGRAEFTFSLAGFDRELVESEGWVGFADKRY
ncbi:MAG: 3-isopropylmalate dehydratase small subunit [Nitrospirae bacterium]|nr:3-isopropylmalate dehydratase small subunit [Nitrospirota bacterium]